MTLATRATALLATVAIVLALPAVAPARTKRVSMGLPSNAQNAFNQKYGVDVNDYFPHTVRIHAGDSIRFVPSSFHTVDIPPKGGAVLPLFSPTGQKIAGITDAAAMPFWFNGLDQLAFTPALLQTRFGKRSVYRGTNRFQSGVPLGENLKPATVKFPKAGTYRYYCNVHAGMKGTVRVVRKRARIPSARQDARALKAQLARDLQRGKTLRNTKPPARTVYTGAAAPGGVELFAMLPSSLTVPVGTTVRFMMSPRSLEDHTATFGPGDPEQEPTSYLGAIAASFQGAAPDPRALYPSEPPATLATLTPALHGNGFWNTGVMDRSPRTPLPPARDVTFGAAGTYQFYCMIHPFMHGTVVVQ